MPTYTLEDKETGEQHDVLMTWDDLQEYKKGNPNLKQVITGGPAIVGGVGNRTGLGQSGGFNEMLSKVADAHPRSELGKSVRRRSAKEVKTDQIVDKHVKIQQQMKKEGKPLSGKGKLIK
jgi:predicted nucleic acid-binding Zn ribbon protein|tara:strand:+ start:1608 stop:1967 length:360 start_codon:yes stop_codon:yes gene_type:complete